MSIECPGCGGMFLGLRDGLCHGCGANAVTTLTTLRARLREVEAERDGLMGRIVAAELEARRYRVGVRECITAHEDGRDPQWIDDTLREIWAFGVGEHPTVDAMNAKLREVEAERDAAVSACRCVHEPEVNVFDPRSCPVHGYEEGMLDGKKGLQASLTAALAEVERMRPVVRAAVYYESLDADAEFDECAKLDAAVDAYLSTTPTPPPDPERIHTALAGVFPKPERER